jgi:outer membrane lipoprotein-sorting protein
MRIVLILIGLLFVQPALAVIAPDINTPENRKILTTVENAYNQIGTLQAQFAQFNSKVQDDLQTGTLYLDKPGKMRLVYEKGSPLEFYAVNGYLIYHDKEAKEVSYFELAQTPVELILKEKLSFEDPAFVVTEVQDILDEYYVTAHKKDAKELGSLTLIIDKETMQLKQWDVLDMAGITSTVSLFDTKVNIPVDKRLFLFQNPYQN